MARRADPEEIVLSAYRSFFAGARRGRYGLGRAGDLWRLLSSIAAHELLKRVRHERAARRSIVAEVPLDRVDETRFAGRRAVPSPEESVDRMTLLRHPELTGRFIEESRIIGGLRHPNIVGTEGLGRTAGGSYFIVMDLVRGGDLAGASAGLPVAEGRAIGRAIEICEALEHAHERGIVHCDLKPANILLDGRGRAQVTDFGLARVLGGGTPGTAVIEGTAPSMAPEQASRAWGPIDRRTDVYGIGAVFFTLLTGRPPMEGSGLEQILARVASPTPAPPAGSLRPGLSAEVEEVCRRCLAKAPGDRYPDVRAIRDALGAGSK